MERRLGEKHMKCNYCDEEHDEMYAHCRCRNSTYKVFVHSETGNIAPFCDKCATTPLKKNINFNDYSVLECRKCASTSFEILVTAQGKKRDENEIVVQCAKCKIIASDNEAYDKMYKGKK